METPRNTVRSPRAKIRGLVQRALATLGVLAVALTGAVVAAAPAQAASPGYGLGTWGDRTYGYFGSFRAPDGALIYCFQPSMPAPLGATGAGILSGPGENGLPSDPNRVAGMNRVISTWGQTTDPVQAMAVMKATQALATSPATVITQYGNTSGTTWGDLAAWVQPSGVALTGAQQAQFVAQVTEYYDIGLNTVAGGGSGTPSGTLDFAIVGTNDYNGTVTAVATGTSGATTGTIVLTNAVFNSTGTNTLAGAQIGVPYEFTGTPANPEWDASEYTVSGTGNFTTGGDGFAANLTVYLTNGEQSAAGAGTRSQTDFTLSGADPAARGVGFAPIVETQVSSVFLEEGDIPADSLLFGTQADDDGLSNPWFRSSGGRYAPVSAEGVLYGPTTGAPVQSPSVPANAEVAATATVTTDPATDPTVTPTIVEASNAVTEAGYYTWVWTITDTMQRDSVREFLPSPYSYSHDYGLVPETSIRGMMLGAVSQVTDEEAPLAGTVGDSLTVSAPVNGNWIERDGGKIPVTYRASTYFVTDEPVRADTVPADAELLATQTLTINRPGVIDAEPVTAPIAEGYMVWVWEIRDADQAIPGYVDEWSDGWSTPGEIARISAPTVTTNAQPGAKLGEEPGLFDVATVTDPIPAAPTTLDFEAFKVPVVKDETTDEWVIDYPEGFEPSEEPGANNLTWVCDAEPVFTTEEAIHVTAEGDFTSESFVPEEFGKYLWVETLTTIPAEGEEALTIHRGECGIAEESSVIVDVTTKAQTDNGDQTVDTGEQAWDKAILNGYVPEGSTVTIVGHQTSESTPVTEACTAETQVFEWTSEPLPGGMAENLEVDSAKFTPAKLGNDSKVYFIETTKDALGRTVSTGECGEPDETLSVKGDGDLAWTGGDSTPALWVGGFALMALIGAAGAYMIRRRQTA